jgi:hypothetical protein
MRNRSGLAEAPQQVVAPPDATPFRAAGEDYYLHMGAADMMTLQRKWGFNQASGESVEDLQRKKDLFYARLDGGGPLEDNLDIIEVALTTWAQKHNGGRAVARPALLKVLEQLEPPVGEDRRASFLMIQALTVRFLRECFGLSASASTDGADPNAPSGEASIQSSS